MTRPALTVLQLDTRFPRIPGDVACPDTYAVPIEVLLVPKAKVGRIVTDDPMAIDIAPFEEALAHAQGEVIVTSCGFLAPWQAHLQALTDRPLIASSLGALDGLVQQFSPAELIILTFDDAALSLAHLGGHGTYLNSIVGLPKTSHLRDVIAGNRTVLDVETATQDVTTLLADHCSDMTRHILLECTNLPPYKSAITQRLRLPCTDILTRIEDLRPGTVAPAFR